MSLVLKLEDRLQSLGFSGQISGPSFSDFRSDFLQSEHCRTTAMYPSNAAGDWTSGNKSGSELRSEAPRSGSNPARPRLVKIRRGPSSRSSEISRSGQVGPGFNPFRPESEDSILGSSGTSEPFVFGAGRSEYSRPGFHKNVVLDELKGLRISGVTQKAESFSVSEEMKKLNIGLVGTENLHDDLKKMNIREDHGKEKSKSGNASKDNVGGSSSAAKKEEIDSGLSNELTRKLSMKFGEDSSVAGEFGGTIRDQIGNLNIEDSSNTTTDDKANPKSFAKDSSTRDFGSNSSHNLESDFKVPKLDKVETKQEYERTPSFEFKTAAAKPANLFSCVKEKVEFNATRDSIRDPGMRKKGGKLRGPTKVQLWLKQDFAARESSSSSSQEIPEASDSYSPMEVSPYRETLAETRENSSSDDSVPPKASSVVPVNEDLATAMERMDINYDEGGETKEEHSDNDNTSAEEGTESFKSANEEVDFIETEVSLNSPNLETGANFCFSAEDRGGSSFTFSASTASQSQSLNLKRLQKKKNVIKFGHESNVSSPTAKVSYASPLPGTSLLSSPGRGQKGDPPSLLRRTTDIYEAPKAQATNFGSGPTSTASSIAAQEACEKWRLRGNQAYTSGDLSKAEDCYTRGISCISKGETSRSCLRALMLCYSNRAATRISLGRMRDALEDCKMGAEIDPNFLRVQVRAANCYLSLGEVEGAVLHFRRCLQAGSDICVDRKIAVEASDGLQKVQNLSECMNRSSELLLKKTSNDVESALGVIAEALKTSPYSEKLLEMKAEALFLMRRYDDAIELCEQTLNSSEKNSPLSANTDVSKLPKHIYFRVWRCRISLKSHFQLGRLEEGLASLEKQEEKLSATHRNESKVIESLLPLTVTIRELLRHKAAGNEAFQVGKHTEAVERYTASLSCNVESRPFAAICFCNRAAAFKALGQITDAIADCSLAMALDGNYLKAISRRATLYEMIRDYGQAARDLERLTDRITKQLEEKANQSDRSHSSTASDLRQARLRLSEIEEESRKDIPLDMYLILGIEPSVSTSEIKKAYRKAALRHHPDKAGQFLARSDNGDDGLWKEIAEEVYKDADRLFKMIGEAYAVLSDPNKRARYDAEEEMRSVLKKRNGNSSSRPQTEFQNYPFERSGRRQWQDVWRSYGGGGHSTATWSEASRSNRYT